MATKNLSLASIAIGAVIGTGSTFGISAIATTGEVTYKKTEVTRVTEAKAACIATCVKNANAWSGKVEDQTSFQITKQPPADGGPYWTIQVDGTKSAEYMKAVVDLNGQPLVTLPK